MPNNGGSSMLNHDLTTDVSGSTSGEELVVQWGTDLSNSVVNGWHNVGITCSVIACGSRYFRI